MPGLDGSAAVKNLPVIQKTNRWIDGIERFVSLFEPRGVAVIVACHVLEQGFNPRIFAIACLADMEILEQVSKREGPE